MTHPVAQQALSLYRETFREEPLALAFAPGRVELLGNHTDYNGGYVMCAALDRITAVAAGPAPDEDLAIASKGRGRETRVSTRDWAVDRGSRWARYVAGTLKELRGGRSGGPGMRLAVASDIPVGTGLSSSAALEVATARAALALEPRPIDPMDLALLCQRAENDFVGVGCGLMDQFAAVFGEANSALFLDCQTRDWMSSPLPEQDLRVAVIGSMVPHALSDGAFNQRRRECADAAAGIGRLLRRPVATLREVAWEEFLRCQADLEEPLRRRARHVVGENRRVLDGLAALQLGNSARFGQIMFASHDSSRENFENSTERLDRIVELARDAPGVVGAKLSGGGFGGSVVSLVRQPEIEVFRGVLGEGFRRDFGVFPDVHICAIGSGARGGLLTA